eukprot:3543804-Prymnesium_polylepis.2
MPLRVLIAAFIPPAVATVLVIGVEAEDAAGMTTSLQNGRLTTLDTVGIFADGAAVRTVGSETCAALRSRAPRPPLGGALEPHHHLCWRSPLQLCWLSTPPPSPLDPTTTSALLAVSSIAPLPLGGGIAACLADIHPELHKMRRGTLWSHSLRICNID